ncbi:MAG TPA: GNAT family N-acetyltransferase [Candidatus Dormibacteraeota bacterium]
MARLFGELHHHNAALDDRFALSDGWGDVLQEHFVRTHSEPQSLWALAWEGREPVGLLIVEAHHDSALFRHRSWAELVAIYVRASHRGGGLAGRLLDAARSWAEERGFDRLQLYVTASNGAARRFYAKNGLRPTQEVWRLGLTPASSSPAAGGRPLAGHETWLGAGHPPVSTDAAQRCPGEHVRGGYRRHLAMEGDQP